MARTKKSASASERPRRTPPPIRKAKARGIKKEFRKTRPLCKVTFTLPGAAAAGAKTVCLLGEFNDWSRHATPLT